MNAKQWVSTQSTWGSVKMEVATVPSSFPFPRRMVAHSANSRFISAKRATVSSSPKPLTLKSSPLSPSYLGASDFSGHKIRHHQPPIKRNVIAMVIPFLESAEEWGEPPPDLATYLLCERIVYLGLPIIPAVTELLVAEFLYLQYESKKEPIYLYINSTGTTKGNTKLGYETEAFAIYDTMRSVKAPLFTLCVGNAWGEAALLLAAGRRGNRYALASSTIMIRQPIGRFQGQATDVEIARKDIKWTKAILVELYAKHMNKTKEEIEADIRRPKYFSPSEAVEYGIIDKVLYNDRASRDQRVVSNLKKENLA